MRTPDRRLVTVHRGRLAPVVLFLLLALVVTLGAPPPSAAEPKDAGPTGAGPTGAGPTGAGPTGAGPTGTDGAPDPRGPRTVTLVTGDVVAWQRTDAGEESAWLVEPAAGTDPGSAQVYVLDGAAHVVPGEAVPYLRSGRLDPNLFNVSHLVRQGFDDEQQPAWPLLVEAEGGPSARRAPATPTGARAVRELDSIKTRSILAAKDGIRATWEAVRGSTVARRDAEDATLAGAGRVWLNERVHANLDESVPQISAPEAWAAGYDGTGVQVAVLDSGWDPEHPDLAEVVSVARNFTQEEDPNGEAALDRNGHGTHVAATVAGSGAASEQDRRGVAPGADLMVGKVLDRTGSGWSDEIIAGMEWAAEEGAEVVNMSLGTTSASDGSDPFSQAVNALTESTGALFVVSAGNTGPDETTVSAPGAADLALTVGAVTKQDEAAAFSSRGPRLGDGAIKPEVVAPGVDIVAARAAGTSLGNLVDEHYTALNGTSMASPHVAGAAAIVAQQQPEWRAAELKDGLVATSAALDEPVTFQGGGRVDVAAAVEQSVSVAPSTLSIGEVAHDDAPLTRTLTYTNRSEEPVVLDLSSEIASTGTDGDGIAAISFDTDEVRVPAGGAASVRVTLTPAETHPGSYAGPIVARRADRPTEQLTTTVTGTVAGPARELRVRATDRNGQPATSGTVDLWSAETGAYDRLWIKDGVATAQVQDGLYSAVTTIDTPPTEETPEESSTYAAAPELVITDDTTLDHDAREAQQVTVDTPRPADVSGFDGYVGRSVGERSFRAYLGGGVGPETAAVIASPEARTGEFTFATTWQLEQPLLTVRPTGRDATAVTPNPQLASRGAPYVGSTTLELVDAGAGGPEDYAGLDVAGKAVLVDRSELDLTVQAAAAEEAGAAVLLVANDRLGRWAHTFGPQDQPVYRLTKQAGEALRRQLAAEDRVSLDLTGIQDATYNYAVAFPHEGSLPDDVHYTVDQGDLAVIRSDYRENSARMSRNEGWVPVIDSIGQGNILGIRRNGPVQRTEYVTADTVSWQRLAQPHMEFPGYYWTWSPARRYAAGEESEQQWWGPMTHPGVVAGYGAEALGSPVARFHDAIRVSMPHYSYGAGLWCTIYQHFGDTSELTLRRDGEVLGTASWPDAQFTVPAEEADYELQLDVVNGAANWADTSTRTESTWSFSSARTDEERTVLPLVQLDYDLTGVDDHNSVRAGSSHPLEITAGYQPGADGPGEFTVTAEVSYDDGDTWAEVPIRSVEGRFLGKVPPAPGGDHASVRVTATDTDDNSLDQRIDRAWALDGR